MNNSFNLADLINLGAEYLEGLPLPSSLRDRLAEAVDTSRNNILANRESEMPVLASVAQDTDNTPFSGYRTAIILHFLHDLLFFVSYLEDLGLEPTSTILFYKDYPYKNKDLVRRCFEDWGYTTRPVSDREEVLNEWGDSETETLIIEDGGYIVPALLRGLGPDVVTGAVEQTSNGQYRDEDAVESAERPLSFPVLSVARSTIKNTFEPRGVAEAVWSNINDLADDIVWEGQEVVVLGYGTIGRSLAHHLRNNNTAVCVYDTDVAGLAHARFDGFAVTEDLSQTVEQRNIRLLIGATGTRSITPEVIDRLPDRTHLASASSRRVEIGVDHLEEQCRNQHQVGAGRRCYTMADGRDIYLLAEGFPINFYGRDSVQNQLIDLIMSQIFLCARELVLHAEELPHEIDDQLVNDLSDREQLLQIFYNRHY